MVVVRSLTALAVTLVLTGGSGAQDAPGRELYSQRCASCHGTQLQGQPEWKKRMPNGRLPAPPHDATGHTWHHSDGQLLRITRDGLASMAPGYETDMPAFGELMDDDEIRAVLDYIKGTWPERERQFQEEKSSSDR